MSIEAGRYKGRGVEGSAQMGHAKTGTEQVGIDLELETGDIVTTVLYFGDKSAQYSLERLRALGCTSLDDAAFPGISNNEVDVVVKYEEYNGNTNMKVEIATGGGGRFQFQSQMAEPQKRSFMAKLKSLDRANNAFPPSSAPAQSQGRRL